MDSNGGTSGGFVASRLGHRRSTERSLHAKALYHAANQQFFEVRRLHSFSVQPPRRYSPFSMTWHHEEQYGLHDDEYAAKEAAEDQGPPPYPEWRGMPWPEYKEWRVAKAETENAGELLAKVRAKIAAERPPKDE